MLLILCSIMLLLLLLEWSLLNVNDHSLTLPFFVSVSLSTCISHFFSMNLSLYILFLHSLSLSHSFDYAFTILKSVLSVQMEDT